MSYLFLALGLCLGLFRFGGGSCSCSPLALLHDPLLFLDGVHHGLIEPREVLIVLHELLNNKSVIALKNNKK